ncbi:MAG: hypothetical protein IPH54_20330 [Rhodoferax sp.]|nr:hypothetical protein [Rhodoferax sp.]
MKQLKALFDKNTLVGNAKHRSPWDGGFKVACGEVLSLRGDCGRCGGDWVVNCIFGFLEWIFF